MNDSDFPWGDRNPKDGYRIGDHVGIIYSDHEHYIFDNPTGVVTGVTDVVDREDDGTEVVTDQYVTVQVEAAVGHDRLYLIRRDTHHMP